MMKKLGILAVLLLACVSFACATEIELNILTTNSTIYVWMNDESPFVCGHGSTASCDLNLSLPVNSTCNQTLLKKIFGNITVIATKVNAINSSIFGSMSSLLTIPQETILLNNQKTDIISGVGAMVQTQVSSCLATSAEIGTLKNNLSRANGEIVNLNTQINGAGGYGGLTRNLADCQSSNSTSTYIMIGLVVALGFVILRGSGRGIPGLSTPKPKVIG